MCSAVTEFELAEFSDEESSGEYGPPWSRASGTSNTRLVQDAGRLSVAPEEAPLKELAAKRAQLEKQQEVVAKHSIETRK